METGRPVETLLQKSRTTGHGGLDGMVAVEMVRCGQTLIWGILKSQSPRFVDSGNMEYVRKRNLRRLEDFGLSNWEVALCIY